MTTKAKGSDLVPVYKSAVKEYGAGACPSDVAIAAGLDAVLAHLATKPSRGVGMRSMGREKVSP